jgi:hypothetical protein
MSADKINTSDEPRIALRDLAEELKKRPPSIIRKAKKLGIRPKMRREFSRGNQMVSTVTHAEATAIKEALKISRRRKLIFDNGQVPSPMPDENELGVFYLIQLEPKHDPGRIKVGFGDLGDRLRKHRCSSPFLECVKSWPCRRTWERAAIDCITEGHEQLHTEVFRTTSIADAVERADKFFALMPKLFSPAV